MDFRPSDLFVGYNFSKKYDSIWFDIHHILLLTLIAIYCRRMETANMPKAHCC